MGTVIDFMMKNRYLLFDIMAVILICTGIAMIYLPAGFIAAGIAVLILVNAKEPKDAT